MLNDDLKGETVVDEVDYGDVPAVVTSDISEGSVSQEAGLSDVFSDNVLSSEHEDGFGVVVVESPFAPDEEGERTKFFMVPVSDSGEITPEVKGLLDASTITDAKN